MNQPRPPAKDRLARYRAMITGALPPRDVWADADGMKLVVAGMDARDQDIICTIDHACPADNRELILKHIEIPADLINMLEKTGALLREKDGEIRQLRAALEEKGGKPAKDYAAECAMKCAEPAFQRFLAERHGLPMPTDKDKAGTRVKFVLRVESRKALNENPAAASLWRDMVKNFEAWRRRG